MTDALHHGVARGRGCPHLGLGSFGRLLDCPPVYTSDALIEALGRPGGLMDSTGPTPDSDIPAGYTFFGQFVDHDITLDTHSALDSDQVQDVDALPNLRSASLDLDCIYGFGPEGSPHLYQGDELVTGTPENADDLARTTDKTRTALVGDPRNDENLFVSQLQLLFHRFHNRLVEEHGDFEAAQRAARFHYQHVVLHDLLKRVCHPEIYAFALERLYRHAYPLIYRPDDHGRLRMPVEFSVAAYRFGHSMVRSIYPVNQRRRRVELFSETRETTGFKPVPKDLVVEWRYLFDLERRTRPAPSKAIDEKLARELNDLPFMRQGEPDANKRSLSFRNLLRGRSLGLPSGQDTARALAEHGYSIDPDVDLRLPAIPGYRRLAPSLRTELAERTPLFFYILRESAPHAGLGKVGSAILMEVFGGMLVHCGTSYLHAGGWTPDLPARGSSFELADIIRYAERREPDPPTPASAPPSPTKRAKTRKKG